MDAYEVFRTVAASGESQQTEARNVAGAESQKDTAEPVE
jgi:hypothetical protein